MHECGAERREDCTTGGLDIVLDSANRWLYFAAFQKAEIIHKEH